jgi:hypothetical protein
MKCQFESTRCLGSPLSEPNCAKGDTLIVGNPKLYVVAPVSNPIDDGSKLRSSGKNPSANRFHPSRASFTTVGVSVATSEIDTSCTRVGVNVL